MRACSDEWNERISAWSDGEVDAAEAARVEAHVALCGACRSLSGGFRRLGGALRAESREAPPAELVSRVRALVPRRARRWPVALGIAAALGVVTVGAFVSRTAGAPLGSRLADDALTQHFKGFASTRPCEFESSDPRAVEEWVRARVGYAVDVAAVPGASLVGARRCSLGGAPAAALVYRGEEGGVTVFVPPPDAVAEAGSGARCVSSSLGAVCVRRDAAGARYAAASMPGDRLLAFLESHP